VSEYLSDLERMVEQIARNFASHPPQEAAARIADHLQRFWDPSMRRDLTEAVVAGKVDVSAVVQDAIAQVTPACPST
jgi:formate dehydrogenase subunit delta